MLTIKEVLNTKDLRDFIYLPKKVHANNPNWLPPIYLDEWKFFNPKKNRSFDHCTTILLIAFDNNKPVGRVMGIINNTYNDLQLQRTARFGFLECFNCESVVKSLLEYIEQWAKKHEMDRIIGPYGFTDKDPQGLMIDGFEHMPIIDSPCNLPYLAELVQACGYAKEFDCFIYRNDLTQAFPQNYYGIVERVKKNQAYTFAEPIRKKELKFLIIPILKLVNNTYSHLYGFIPMKEEEMKELADRYMPIIDPRFVKIAIFDSKIIGFVLGLPNFTTGLQRAKGKLFPFGLLHILRSMKKAKQLDLMLGAVEEAHRGKGIEIALASKLIDTCKKANFNSIEVHLVLESNTQMLSELTRAGYCYHKRFRVFGKDL